MRKRQLLMHEDLPPVGFGMGGSPEHRWIASNKEAVVKAVSSGQITLAQACSRYSLSIDEFMAWSERYDRVGRRGLRALKGLAETRPGTRLARTQADREPPPGVVSNHALVRFCQRVLEIKGLDIRSPAASLRHVEQLGYPLAKIRRMLVDIVAEAAAAGAVRLVRDGVSYVFAGGVLTTVFLSKPVGYSRTAPRVVYDAFRRDAAEPDLREEITCR